MVYKEKELIILACQTQIDNLSKFYEPTHPSRALLVEKFNANGHDEMELDFAIINLIEELEDIQEEPEKLFGASWFNRDAIKLILIEIFEPSLLELLGSQMASNNLIGNLKMTEIMKSVISNNLN